MGYLWSRSLVGINYIMDDRKERRMSRFAVVYEDPEYEDYVTDEEIYIEAGALTMPSEWSLKAQFRLFRDVVGVPVDQFNPEDYSPYQTVNS
jgi:hypothetical protein